MRPSTRTRISAATSPGGVAWVRCHPRPYQHVDRGQRGDLRRAHLHPLGPEPIHSSSVWRWCSVASPAWATRWKWRCATRLRITRLVPGVNCRPSMTCRIWRAPPTGYSPGCAVEKAAIVNRWRLFFRTPVGPIEAIDGTKRAVSGSLAGYRCCPRIWLVLKP